MTPNRLVTLRHLAAGLLPLIAIGLLLTLARVSSGPPARRSQANPPYEQIDRNDSNSSTNSSQNQEQDPPAQPEERDPIGLKTLQRKLADNPLTGKGIVVGHAEGGPGNYLPNDADPSLQDVQLVAHSGKSLPNNHSTATAKVLAGNTGPAPGITTVHCYTSGDWMSRGYLNTGQPRPPTTDGSRIFSHSWISSQKNDYASEVLRRIDYLVDRKGVLMFVGVNNGADKPVDPLLACAYNAIAVGNASGRSSGGYTQFEGDGRCKPEIVTQGLTSFATPRVAACAALLLEEADRRQDKDMARPEVIKAVLLAGAEKPREWKREAGKPLDDHFGAGRLRIDRAHDILTAARASVDKPNKLYAWDYNTLATGGNVSYTLEPPTEPGDQRVSIILTWHRRIDGRTVSDLISNQPYWSTSPRLADMDLRLIRTKPDGSEEVCDQSVSTIDNVEHVYLERQPLGRDTGQYRIEVSRKDGYPEPWTFGVAWLIEPVPAPNAPRR
ncbi:MAG: hypothetical protein GC164_13590 [Phycisphaera sp.]|nr:hypothetical protein [Phycisphaera sp.]